MTSTSSTIPSPNLTERDRPSESSVAPVRTSPISPTSLSKRLLLFRPRPKSSRLHLGGSIPVRLTPALQLRVCLSASRARPPLMSLVPAASHRGPPSIWWWPRAQAGESRPTRNTLSRPHPFRCRSSISVTGHAKPTRDHPGSTSGTPYSSRPLPKASLYSFHQATPAPRDASRRLPALWLLLPP